MGGDLCEGQREESEDNLQGKSLARCMVGLMESEEFNIAKKSLKS